MALDTRFIPISTIPQFILDKQTALAMGNGTFEFYHDNSQSVPKVVYQLVSNAPGIYSYVSVGSLLTLNTAGTFVDGNGAEFIPYLFPYDGDASTTTNTLDLYYIVAKNSTGVQQFTLHGVPNLAPAGSGSSNPILVNHISNGQFQLHNDHAPVPGPTFAYGGARGTVEETPVAPGGIYYERSSGSTATDVITFIRDSQYDPNASASPRYKLSIVRSTISADGVCGLVFRFMDVHKFTNSDTSTTTAPKLTFVFNALSGSGSLSNVMVNQILYYGSGGTATTVTNLESGLTVTTAEKQFATTFTNAPDTAALIGSLDDDFVEFEIAFPTAGTFSVQITDVMLLNGTYTVTPGSSTSILFPQLTNGQFLLEAASNVAPTTQSPYSSQYYPQDGSNLYLPQIMTVSGWTYDYSQIGNIVTKFTTTSVGNELLCNGTQYLTSDYSALGIPYSRLQKVLFNSTLNGPIFGTGANWVNIYLNSGTVGQILLATNKLGAMANPADSGGGTATGWTFVTASANQGTVGLGYIAHANSTNNNVTAISTFTGGATLPATGGTSTMVVANYDQATVNGTKYAFVVSAISAAALAGGGTGLYFDFSNNGINYRMWFHTVAEAAPGAGGRTLIQCNLVATMPASVVAVVIANMLSGFKNFPITITGQPANAGGSYWTFVSNSVTTNVWYKVAGLGSAPAGASSVQVTLTGSETAAQVATLTQTAINSQYFAVPDLRGLFLRGLDDSASPQWDLDIASRTGLFDTITTTLPGTLEFQQLQTHSHGISTFNAGNNAATVGQGNGANADSATTATQGGSETRPVNMAVNYFIKY